MATAGVRLTPEELTAVQAATAHAYQQWVCSEFTDYIDLSTRLVTAAALALRAVREGWHADLLVKE